MAMEKELGKIVKKSRNFCLTVVSRKAIIFLERFLFFNIV